MASVGRQTENRQFLDGRAAVADNNLGTCSICIAKPKHPELVAVVVAKTDGLGQWNRKDGH